MMNDTDLYFEQEKELREECDRMVTDGELTEEEANFRYFMMRDEYLVDFD